MAEITAVAPSTPPQERPKATTLQAESILAEMLADLLHVDHVPVDSHFFEELGGDSLVMAHFCARVRKRGDLPKISIRDIYQHPTIRSLALALADAEPRAVQAPLPAVIEVHNPASTLEYVVCGALQLLSVLGYSYLAVIGAGQAYEWISSASNLVEMYLRSVVTGVAGFLVACIVPILAKWVLIGRWKPGHIRLWSLTYVRFWVVKTLIRANPLVLLFSGTSLYNFYLRALGARIGSGAAIFSRRMPVCTDLLTVGAGAVVRKEVFFQCYRAHAGRLEIGSVTLGRDVFIGENSVLDINTSMGDGAQLGHGSALYSGHTIPAGERWHGSPAQRTEVDYLRVAPAHSSTMRRVAFCTVLLILLLLVYMPFVERSPYLLAAAAPSLNKFVNPAKAGVVTLQQFFLDALEISALSFFGTLLVGLAVVVTVPRVLNLFLKPNTVYPLYGFRDWVHRMIGVLTNNRFFLQLFGDSSYIVHYLSWLGYKLKPLEQTGSNFGTNVIHANPFLCSVGTGTIIADGLHIINEEVSSTSFCVTQASIGPRSFLGNNVTYAAGARTGDNCLLATKVMVPLDGKVREGVGLLGSPCFEIPRTVDRDTRFDDRHTGEQLRRGLAAKDRYNLRTIGLFLFARWLGVLLFILLALAAFELYDTLAHVVTAALLTADLLVTGLYVALVDRCVAGFRSLQPTYCSIYDRDFWRHERLWKVADDGYLHAFDGTAFKNVLWRAIGVRIGKRVFDDGVHISEKTLATIGDYCVLNTASTIQCHSQEDATFKSDRSALGARCTVGVGALVHYGVTMGDDSVLAPDSFLMKGSEVLARARWGGNPAREM